MAKKKEKMTTAVTKYDEMFAEEAAKYAKNEKPTQGKFISIRGGVMSYEQEAFPGNCIYCVILHSVHTNILYDGPFDPENPTSPICYAIAEEEEGICPHPDVEHPQNAACKGCRKNEWGTADKGKGKACGNTRRLAVIMAGDFNPKTEEFTPYREVEDFEDAEIAFLKVPVTSVKEYGSFVHSVNATLKRPPWGIVTKISLEPNKNPKSTIPYFVKFEAVQTLDADVVPIVKARHEEAMETIGFGFMKVAEDNEEEKPKRRKPAGKATKGGNQGKGKKTPAKAPTKAAPKAAPKGKGRR